MRALISVSVLFLMPLLAQAGGIAQVQDRAVIDDSVRQYQGNFSVNQAAGEQQQQINSRALAIGNQAHTSTAQHQQLELINPDPSLDASSSIRGHAFQGSGILGVNQGAGLGNQQINALRITVSNTATHPQSLDDSDLAQSVALFRNSGSPVGSPGQRVVSTDDRAFAGSGGVVQVNQSAGVGNQTYNNLSIRVAGGP
ncbi:MULTISPECIES: adhesin [Pseudomonas]|jgi:hypothetical protein|uniref:adhesin n=1 Tax=Pseudomonas citronellolis TaxID=53408 RepID=UPI0008533183|nr:MULTISPECIES: adhesin [Pseudomonas]